VNYPLARGFSYYFYFGVEMSRHITPLLSDTIFAADFNRAFQLWNGEKEAAPKPVQLLLSSAAVGNYGSFHSPGFIDDNR